MLPWKKSSQIEVNLDTLLQAAISQPTSADPETQHIVPNDLTFRSPPLSYSTPPHIPEKGWKYRRKNWQKGPDKNLCFNWITQCMTPLSSLCCVPNFHRLLYLSPGVLHRIQYFCQKHRSKILHRCRIAAWVCCAAAQHTSATNENKRCCRHKNSKEQIRKP